MPWQYPVVSSSAPTGPAGGDLTGTYPNPTVANTATITPKAVAPAGLTGAVAASRYVGATASGAPTAGTFAVGDYVVDQQGRMWFCITAGTPGTWISSSGLVYSNVLGVDTATFDTGATIPATGAVLDVYALLRTDEVAVSSTVECRLNNDSGANYIYTAIRNLNTTVSGVSSLSATGIIAGGQTPGTAAASNAAGVATALRITIPAYAGTTFFKAGTSHSGLADTTAANDRVGVTEFVWKSTVAINQFGMVISSGSGQKFLAGSALYVYIR